ncbi:XRE family transcriptional regulator [Streptomyces sp. NPDC004629]|uniref:XRE family transcriptional regulator n=1 Tax=Streptomyces sp. NPDC004629 TaxID=3364705 RepID=UPI003693149B
MLWPAATKKAIKVGPDREVVAVYPYRSSCPASLWRSLIAKAGRELTFAGYTNYFLWLEQARFGAVLRRKAAQGCRVRFLLGGPDSDLTRSRERDEGGSVFRFDDDMIVTPLLTHSVGHDAPTLHLRRHQDDGMFDRFVAHAEELWKRGTPVWEEGHE